MKRAILLCSVALIAATSLSANEKYYKKMGETISQFATCQSPEDFQDLANKFRVISNVETGEWLPLYYEAQCYILMSIIDNSGAGRKDEYLDVAEISIKKMLEMAPGESEAYTLQAFYHTGRLVVDPPSRAQTTSPLIAASIGKALGIDPENPRALYIKLSNEMGTAQYFGTDTAPLCEAAQKLLEQWDSYELKSPIHPAWGKDQVENLVRSCGD